MTKLNSNGKKPWPSEAVIIVASKKGEEIRENMESAHDGRCRDCGGWVVFDGYTWRRANIPSITRGRPVEFLCTDCLVNYDPSTITYKEDHRRHATQNN